MKTINSFNSIKRIFRILNFEEKKKILTLLFFIFITFFLEMISVTLVVPIVTLIFDNNFIDKFSSSELIPSFFFNFSAEELLQICLISIVTIYLIKTLFLVFFSYWKANFIYGLHKKYAEKIVF